MDYVHLYDYNNPVDAHLARLILDDNEIPCHVADLDTLQAGLGHVALYVAADRVAEACALLEQPST